MTKTKYTLLIYEGALCCASGVCGSQPNKELIEFKESLAKLQKDFKDLNIVRANLSSNLNIFLENKVIFDLLKENGPEIFPVIALNDKIISKKRYLKYQELKKELENILN
ncbi:MAG: arsenic metallochaperone ArsD family protein [Candidatus Omnitrophica bacterium]|nr:arsenic metallochaperone ArsD family protein [Candidatus Omnitrophota bacterium]